MAQGRVIANNMDLFPYEYIGDQAAMVDLIRRSATDGKAVIMESGTGTGKTAVSMTGALEASLGTGRKVLYLTRTKSQQRQIVIEAERISKNVPLLCAAVQGRSIDNCPMMSSDPELNNGTPEELSKLCSEYKKKDGNYGPCKYYENIANISVDEFVGELRDEHLGHEAFAEKCLKMEVCPYEMMKRILPYADIIAAPYVFFFVPFIRSRFLEWVGKPLSELAVVIDEAHNLPDYLRDVMTVEYSSAAMDLAEKEAMEWKDPEIHGGLTVTDVIEVLRECMKEAISEYLHDDDGLIPTTFLQDELMSRLGMSSNSLNAIYKGLMDRGEMIVEAKKARRKLPRSYIGSMGKFLTLWNMSDEEVSVCLIIGGENPKFQSYCLDPRLAAEPLRYCGSSVHMSGTLSPLGDYEEEIGLIDPVKATFPSPFPKENLKVMYVDDVSTKYDELKNIPETYDKIRQYVIDIAKCTDRNTAVFFPSYTMMERMIADGTTNMIGKGVFAEKRNMTQTELMEEVIGFRMSEGGVMFAVTGGRVSEGLDFPDKDLEVAVLVGIPYPKQTSKQEALRRYCDLRFGNGWEHSSKIPAMRKMRQSIGRLIRSETDRGVAVILDRRAFTLEDISADLTNDPCSEITNFFAGQR